MGELVRLTFGQALWTDCSTCLSDQVKLGGCDPEPIMSNGNPLTPTPQELAELFNAMKEELQELKNERAERNKREGGKPHKETEDGDDDTGTSGVLKTKRSKAISKRDHGL
ncbi:hypothetical protein PIB30_006509 [Stylosanthes scabra]|uniref:Uncharacterized protein n=1 Tax=Stylosanthes scabra TaxID=79078 RepID=A0ABU6W2M3_9FABA|nr:hypothetical protein [Stylosanthes scabra]